MADIKDTALSRSDLQFLLATSAREESGLREVAASLASWDYQKKEVVDVLLEFLRLGEIDVTAVADGKFSDCDSENAQRAIEAIQEQTNWWSPLIFLTENGAKRYEIDDWGITTERAKYLMFSNNANKNASTDA